MCISCLMAGCCLKCLKTQPWSQPLCSFITTQNLPAPDWQILCASFCSFILLKKKKNLFSELSLAETNRKLLHCSLPEAVLFRLGCSRQQIKRNLENKASLLCWVTFDSLKRSRISLLSSLPKTLPSEETLRFSLKAWSFHLCSYVECFLKMSSWALTL